MTRLVLAASLAASIAGPVLADEIATLEPAYSLGEMQYDEAGSSFVLNVRNTGKRAIGQANFICHFITEDMTPFDATVIYVNDLAPKESTTKRVSTDSEAYSAVCEFASGRFADGGFFFPDRGTK